MARFIPFMVVRTPCYRACGGHTMQFCERTHRKVVQSMERGHLTRFSFKVPYTVLGLSIVGWVVTTLRHLDNVI